PGGTALHVVSLADRLADTAGVIESAARAAAPRSEVRLSGCAALGTFRVLLGGAGGAEVTAITNRARHRIAAIGGSAVIARGSAELRKAVDPWGPIEPGSFALMRALRDEFDPGRVLNPGRYVGDL